MTLTNEQMEQYREIVENAPKDAGNYHCEFKRYFGGTNARNLNDLQTILAQHDEIERLRELIKGHNDECEALCQPEQCGYAQYKRDCPNCPKSMLIDTEALSK